MRPCKSINVFYDSTFTVSAVDQVARVCKAGFKCLDMNFWDWSHDPASPFRADDWEKWVEGIGEKAASLGAEFRQSHANVYNFYDHPDDEVLYETYLRSIKGSAMLNVPWITFHGSFNAQLAAEQGREKVYRDNIEFFKPLVEMAGKLNTGIALENLRGTFPTADDLIAMVDKLAEYGPVGVCWDTGHAHVSKVPQRASIRRLGDRLHALHVQDNDGVTDQHTAPFYGNIDWKDLVAGLKEIGYKGEFTFEGHNFVRTLPEPLKDEGLRMMYLIGETLVNGL